MKAFLIGLMFVAVASAGRVSRKRDVSEYVAAGWSKNADGYAYDIPEKNLDTPVETYYEEPVYSAPVTTTYVEEAAPVYNAPAAAEAAYVEPAYTAGGDYEVATEYYAPEQEYTQDQTLREYLPPALRRRRLRVQKRRLRFVKRH